MKTVTMFTNELGNAIVVRVDSLDTDGFPGLMIEITGPKSSHTNHITLKEAQHIHRNLSRILQLMEVEYRRIQDCSRQVLQPHRRQ